MRAILSKTTRVVSKTTRIVIFPIIKLSPWKYYNGLWRQTGFPLLK